MVKAIFKTPKLKTKKVWAGLYGGHYDVIVFFNKKPKPSKEERNNVDGEWYDCGENNDLIIGNMCLQVFYELYPDADLSKYTQTDGSRRPKDIEISEVFQMELTTFFDDYGNLYRVNTDEDEWNR